MTPTLRALLLLGALAGGALPLLAQDAVRPPLSVTDARGRTARVPWVDESTIEEVAATLSRDGGGTIRFPAGIYEFDRGVRLRGIDGVRFIGEPGCVFRLRPITEFGRVRLAADAKVESGVLRVDHPELLRAGRRYQITRPDLRGNRVIELRAASLEGDAMRFDEVLHDSVKTLPAGGWVVPELNFFTGFSCSRLVFRGIEFDGNHDIAIHDLGDKEFIGHTAHCGLLFWNGYHGKPDAPIARPATRGLSVVECTFRGLLGRGVVAYNMADIEIRDCRLEDFGAEAIEIDHLSSDVTISRCAIRNARVGIRLNDCSDVIVTGSHINTRITGIHVTRVVEAEETNCRLVISANVFTDGRRAVVIDAESRENIVTNNSIARCDGIAFIVKGDDNLLVHNLISGCPGTAILVEGTGNRVDENTIVPPASRPENYTPIKVVSR